MSPFALVVSRQVRQGREGEGGYIALQVAGVLDAQNFRGVPGVAADALQPV